METLITIYGEKYRVECGKRYRQNRTQPVLEIFDFESGMPCGVISVCLPGAQLEENQTVLKPIENANIVEILVNSGIAKFTGKVLQSGYGRYPVVELGKEFVQSCK